MDEVDGDTRQRFALRRLEDGDCLESRAFAFRARAMVDLAAGAADSERAHQREQFVAGEVAATSTIALGSATAELNRSQHLVESLPATWQGLEDGWLRVHQALVLMKETLLLSPELCCRVEQLVLRRRGPDGEQPAAAGPPRHRPPAGRRARRAPAQGGVRGTPGDDATAARRHGDAVGRPVGRGGARVPLRAAAARRASRRRRRRAHTAAARGRRPGRPPAAGALGPAAGRPRTGPAGERGGAPVRAGAGGSRLPDRRAGPLGAGGRARARDDGARAVARARRARRLRAHQPGPRSPAAGRREQELRRLLDQPLPQPPPAEPQHDPSPTLSRLVGLRDLVCIGPGGGRASSRTDREHRIAWPDGPTSAENLAPVSRYWHRAKQAGWSYTRSRDGTTTWTSPLGRRYRVPPDRWPAPTRATTPPETAAAPASAAAPAQRPREVAA